MMTWEELQTMADVAIEDGDERGGITPDAWLVVRAKRVSTHGRMSAVVPLTDDMRADLEDEDKTVRDLVARAIGRAMVHVAFP